MKVPNLTFCWGREHQRKRLLPELHEQSFRIQHQKNLRIERVGTSATKFEVARIHFLSDVFVASWPASKLSYLGTKRSEPRENARARGFAARSRVLASLAQIGELTRRLVASPSLLLKLPVKGALFLNNDVFEQRTSTGSGLFALFGSDSEQILGKIVSLRVKTLSNTNLVA